MEKDSRPKVYDCFTFFNEIDLLEIRLRILSPVVDKFVIVEMDRTFSDDPKEYCFEKNKIRFKKWEDKITYIKATNNKRLGKFYRTKIFRFMTKLKLFRVLINRFELGKWRIEKYQRDKIFRGLTNCSSGDIILISDLDEIPNPKIIENLAKEIKYGERAGFNQKMFFYYLNGFTEDFKWIGTKAVTFKTLVEKYKKSPQRVRVARDFLRNVITGDIKEIKEGGWHFTYLGDEKAINKKIASFSEVEKIEIKKEGKSPRIILGEKEHTIKIIKPSKKNLPEEIYKNQKKYSHLIKKST